MAVKPLKRTIVITVSDEEYEKFEALAFSQREKAPADLALRLLRAEAEADAERHIQPVAPEPKATK
jgi:hypothetical protein